jgi:hypothetical protein
MFLMLARTNYNVFSMKSEAWIGHKFERLTIVAFLGIKTFAGGGRATMFRFRCDCGAEFDGQKSNVVGKRIDCGCSKTVTRTAPYGSHRHPLNKTWHQMIARCENPAGKSFKDYGARGIRVCQRWKLGAGGRTGFECFVSDMGPRPPGFTIERVQSDGNYEPGNCVWLSKADQSKNRRTVRLVRLGDQVKTVPDWCDVYGLSYWTAIRRIQRGWPPDKAVTTPARGA